MNMNFQIFALILIYVFVPLFLFWVKSRLENSIRTEFDRRIVSLQSILSYKQLSIAKSFEKTITLNELLWNSFWAHLDLGTPNELPLPEREKALKVIQDFKSFLFSNQIYFDNTIYEASVRAVVNMLALSRYRAANRTPPEVRTGKDIDMEQEISNRISEVAKLIREKFELPALPADLRLPQHEQNE
jgi:hypothetical protein